MVCVGVSYGSFRLLPREFAHQLTFRAAKRRGLQYKLVIEIPDGVDKVSIDKRHGWEQTYTYRDLPPSEQYTDSHGHLVTQVLDTVTITAKSTDALIKNKERGVWSLSVKFGRLFADANSNSKWNGFYTQWFKMTQYIVPDSANPSSNSQAVVTTDEKKLEWTGTGSGTDMWHMMKPKPSPYLKLLAWNDCTNKTIDWFGDEILSPHASTVDPATVAEVEGYVDEELYVLSTSFNRHVEELRNTKQNKNDGKPIAIAGLAFGFVGFLLGGYAIFATHYGSKVAFNEV